MMLAECADLWSGMRASYLNKPFLYLCHPHRCNS